MPAVHRWALIATVSGTAGMVVVDATVMNLAVPAIVADLGATSGQAAWIHESYTLVFAALLLCCGRIADRVGRRRMLVLGSLVLAGASTLGALAPSTELLLAARAVQGIGAAMIFPATLSVLGATFRGPRRSAAFAAWGATIGVTMSLGALVGGWLTTMFSWRAAVLVFVVAGVLLAVGVRAVVPESRADGPVTGIDLVGAALSVVAVGAGVLAITEGRGWGWWSATGDPVGWPLAVSPVPLLVALAVVAGAAFVARQRRRTVSGAGPLLDLRLLRVPSFRNGTLIATLTHLGEFGLMFVLPFWWQNALGYSAAGTATTLLAPTLAGITAGICAPALVSRFGALSVVRVGLALEAIGAGGLAFTMTTDTSFLTAALFLGPYGFGLGLASAQLGSIVLAEVPGDSAGAASGTMTTAQQIGSALGVAVLGLALLTTLTEDLTGRLGALGVPSDVARGYVDQVQETTGGAIAGLAEQGSTSMIADAARVSLSQGVAVALGVAALALLLSLLATRTLRDPAEVTAAVPPARGRHRAR